MRSTVRGIIADNDIQGHVRLLVNILEGDPLREYWRSLGLGVKSFANVGLARNSPDRLVWTTCQELELVLITANRRQKEPDSLEATIRGMNTATSLPVLTLADPIRVLAGKAYTRKVADRLLGYLLDMHFYLGGGRLYLP